MSDVRRVRQTVEVAEPGLPCGRARGRGTLLLFGSEGWMDMLMFDFERLALGAAVGAALRTGLLMKVAAGRTTVRGLATELALEPRALELLVGVLATESLVVRDADGDGIAPGPALTPLASGPGGLALSLGLFSHLEAFVRTGEPFVKMDLGPAEREAAYRSVVGGLGAMFEEPARDLAARLSLTPTPKSVLDVGCGSGVWSLAIAARHPEARVTGLDLPAVLDNFSSRAAQHGLSARVATIAGNMHDVTIPEKAFDLVVIANVLRLEPPEQAGSVVQRVARAVADGGALLVVDALAHGTPERERSRAIYALHLGLRTKNGRVHAPQTITRWLADAGFGAVESIDVAGGAGGVGALLARRSR
jgi:SAM-dependent methyltransferase